MKNKTPAFTRRDFLRLGGASLAGSLLAACGDEITRPITAGIRRWGDYGGSGTVTRYPLRIPATVSPNGLTLTEQAGTVSLGGQQATAWMYNGSFPGPTIVARTGDTARIVLRNSLPEETITHWHGLIVPSVADGQPQQAIAPGATYSYEYPILQRAGLNFYHPHPHGLTGKQVGRGLAGAYVIRDAEEDALGLPSGAYEVPLVLRTAGVGYNGVLGGTDDHNHDDSGALVLVNGTRDPYLDVDTALYRFRVLNGSNAAVFRLSLSNGAPFTLIGNDGGLLETATQLTQIDAAPAERFDLLVDFRGLAVGTRVTLRVGSVGGWSGSQVDALEFRVVRQVSVPAVVPGSFPAIPKLLRAEVKATRDFRFGSWNDINGRSFSMDRIDFRVPWGQTELWRFIAGRGGSHPVHVHGTSFQVQSRTGGRGKVFAWEQGWKDVVMIQDNETVEVLVRFDHQHLGVPYKGRYLMHCHRLEHEDAGMMLNFEVI